MLPSQFTDAKGRDNKLGMALLALTFLALVYKIYESHKHIKFLKEGKASTQHDIDELRLNLKNALGNKYQTLS